MDVSALLPYLRPGDRTVTAGLQLDEAELVGGPMDGQLIRVPRCRSDELPLQYLRVERWLVRGRERRRGGALVGAYERGLLSEDTHRWTYRWYEVQD